MNQPTYGDLPPLELLLKNVEYKDGCWIWTSHVYGNYGQIKYAGKGRTAHRVSYMLHKGDVPQGLELDHLCKNKLCINPDHLEAVTHWENMRRANAGWKNRNKTHCFRGHEFNVKNTRNYEGRRICKECVRLQGVERRKQAKLIAKVTK